MTMQRTTSSVIDRRDLSLITTDLAGRQVGGSSGETLLQHAPLAGGSDRSVSAAKSSQILVEPTQDRGSPLRQLTCEQVRPMVRLSPDIASASGATRENGEKCILGVHLKVLTADLTNVTSVNTEVQSAVASHPDFIVNITRESADVYAPGLAAAKAAHIPAAVRAVEGRQLSSDLDRTAALDLIVRAQLASPV
jgi:hypothetical protein